MLDWPKLSMIIIILYIAIYCIIYKFLYMYIRSNSKIYGLSQRTQRTFSKLKLINSYLRSRTHVDCLQNVLPLNYW